ncbi:fructosamine kinase family protein [Salinimicrobium sp. CDJ15-81-2]|nr:fructosamine kinase family protein [Salinimicrobium nanhaiense]
MSVQRDEQLIYDLENTPGFKVNSIQSLAGGSINRVYLLGTSEGKKVIKINASEKFPGMFAAEKEGLETIKRAEAFDIPETYSCAEADGLSYLLLEYKKEGAQKPDFWKVFGRQLANLHRNTAEAFGFSSNNYIGSLPQYNDHRKTAADFFISQRLEPQMKMAFKNGFSLGDLSGFYRNISEEIPQEPPALLHGDLWSGNYLINEEGLPCLIDPAVCYGPREMDLAMMKLFGGFPEEVFQEYDRNFPLQAGWEKRIELWQLYYLLVHLNIFGRSYLPQVKEIIRRFS